MIRTIEKANLIKAIVRMYPDEVKREIRRRDIYKEDNLGQLGHCSICGGNDGYFNIERNHYFFCKKHKKCWCIGSNLFSSWRKESEDIWKKNKKKFAKYNEISGSEWIENKIKSENLDIEKDVEESYNPLNV